MPRPIVPTPDIGGHHAALPSTPSEGEDGKGIAWDHSAGAFAWATMGGGGGGVTTGRSGGWPLAGISLGSEYEADGGYVQLARRTTFPVARAIALADSEYGWTWANRAALTSADESATMAGACTLVHGGTDTRFEAATQTCPRRYKVYGRRMDRCSVWMARLAIDANENYEYIQLFLKTPGAATPYVRIGPGYQAGNKISSAGSAGYSLATITYSQCAAGVWVAITLEPSGTVATWYHVSASATPPSSGWVLIRRETAMWAADQAEAGIALMTYHSGGTAPTGTVHYYDDSDASGTGWSDFGPAWCATQYDATSAAQWAGYVDLGSDSPAIDLADLRLDLASRANLRAGDTATAEWSLVRSVATASPGASSWNVAAALVEDGAGRYLHIYCRIVSTGDEQGSVWWGSPIVIWAA